MALSIQSRVEDGCAVLELSGALTLGPTLGILRETARELLSVNKLSAMILHMGGVTAVDSSGLGELTVVYTLTARRDCRVGLVEANANLRRMLEMTRIDELLPTFQDLATAKAELCK